MSHSSVVLFTSVHYPEVTVVLRKPTSAIKQAILIDSANSNRMVKEAAVRYAQADRMPADKQDIAILLTSQDEFKVAAAEMTPVYIRHCVKSIKGLVLTDEDGNEEVVDKIEELHAKAPEALTDEILLQIKRVLEMSPAELKNLSLLTILPAPVLGSDKTSSANTEIKPDASVVATVVDTPQS